MITKSAQPILASAAISLLATVIGIVASQIFRWLGIAADSDAQGAQALISSGVAYIGLCIVGMSTGLLPGGLLGAAALVSSVVMSLLVFSHYLGSASAGSCFNGRYAISDSYWGGCWSNFSLAWNC